MLKSLNSQILFAAVAGVAFGWLLSLNPATGVSSSCLYILSLISSLFIGLLKMLLIPLIFSSIVVGVANLQAVGHLGRVWKITLLCFISTTTLALGLGLLCAHLFEPGQGLHITMFSEAMATHHSPESLSPSAFISNFLQNTLINPFKAMAEGNVLTVVIFALLLGAVIVSGRGKFEAVQNLFQQLFAMMMKLVQWVMVLAPFGILPYWQN